MEIERHDPGSILSNAVEYGNTVYLAGVVAKDLGKDVRGQTREILEDGGGEIGFSQGLRVQRRAGPSP
jgi:enamine deaminase RidA (YjgF/YER057c/UK114 family)